MAKNSKNKTSKDIFKKVKGILKKVSPTKKVVKEKTSSKKSISKKSKMAKKNGKKSKSLVKKKIIKSTKNLQKKKPKKKIVKKTVVKKNKIKKTDEKPIKPKIPKLKIAKSIINDVVSEAVGEDSLPIIHYLVGKVEISEFVIADDTEIEIHRVRNILYRLNSEMLVTYIRKKDKEKGWYISYWTFVPKRVLELVIILKEKRLAKFKNRLEKESANVGNFFMCPNTCVRMDFDNATDADFKCPECGSLLNQQDNQRTIETLQENIKKLEKELKEEYKKQEK